MKYIRQLDSIRAIAVLLVIVEHWIPKANLHHRIPYGEVGVDVFFVLSGFLISRILLENKYAVDSGLKTNSTVLKSFYIRRSLRIFPIYYIAIFAALFFAAYTKTRIQIAFPWYLTYTSNWFMFYNGWDGILSHLWSLAVEEQFYIIWPWLILFVSKRWIPHLIIGFILTGILSNYLVWHRPLGTVLTFTCFDAFGMGALLAWLQLSGGGMLKKSIPYFSIAAILAALLFLIGIWRFKHDLVPLRTLVSLIALWLIAYIVDFSAEGSLRGRWILDNRILIFLGKISYGIYLYHNFIPVINEYTLSKWLDPQLPAFMQNHIEKLHLAENLVLLVLLSWLSFVLIEKRFLGLKKYFEYSPERPVATAK
ncbi:MAG TPA: acyltransferase [Chitinophagaceae bacterium]|nr:acyltransferase [Chitinophagaceae bacterium]